MTRSPSLCTSEAQGSGPTPGHVCRGSGPGRAVLHASVGWLHSVWPAVLSARLGLPFALWGLHSWERHVSRKEEGKKRKEKEGETEREREREGPLKSSRDRRTRCLCCSAVTDYVPERKKNDMYGFHFPSGMTCQAGLFDNSMKGIHRRGIFRGDSDIRGRRFDSSGVTTES